jgi:hypothetical protein
LLLEVLLRLLIGLLLGLLRLLLLLLLLLPWMLLCLLLLRWRSHRRRGSRRLLLPHTPRGMRRRLLTVGRRHRTARRRRCSVRVRSGVHAAALLPLLVKRVALLCGCC